MRIYRTIAAPFTVTLIFSLFVAAHCVAQTLPPPLAEDAPYPMVMRIDKSALLQITSSDVDESRPVDKVVLGTRAVGKSRTLGTIRAALIPDSTEASFDVRFLGNTTSKTVGTHEPAVIYCHTFTDFDCTRRVTFDPRKGFVIVGDVNVDGKTRLIYDGFGATKRFGRLLISRVAERRADQSHEQARLIADRDNKREVRESFEKEAAKQVRTANENLDLVRYVNWFLGDTSTLQLYAKSSTECIHIGIGPAGQKYEAMSALPPTREKSAPIEIWVHSSVLSTPVSALIKLTTPKTMVPISVKTQILGMLSTSPTTEDTSIDVAIEDGWLVLGLPNDRPPASPPTALPATVTAVATPESPATK